MFILQTEELTGYLILINLFLKHLPLVVLYFLKYLKCSNEETFLLLSSYSAILFFFLQIYTVYKDGKGLQVLLDKDRGICNPRRVCVDHEGKRLVVINRDGTDIINYNIEIVSYCQILKEK